jgi:hypothetical protein
MVGQFLGIFGGADTRKSQKCNRKSDLLICYIRIFIDISIPMEIFRQSKSRLSLQILWLIFEDTCLEIKRSNEKEISQRERRLELALFLEDLEIRVLEDQQQGTFTAADLHASSSVT